MADPIRALNRSRTKGKARPNDRAMLRASFKASFKRGAPAPMARMKGAPRMPDRAPAMKGAPTAPKGFMTPPPRATRKGLSAASMRRRRLILRE